MTQQNNPENGGGDTIPDDPMRSCPNMKNAPPQPQETLAPENRAKRTNPNQTRLTFAKAQNWLLRRSELSPGAKLIYVRLLQFFGKSGHCFPGQEKLGREVGLSDRQVRRHLKELHRNGLIETERRGWNSSNDYYFLEHPWMAEMKEESDRTKTSNLHGQMSPVGEDINVRSGGTKPSGLRESDKDNKIENKRGNAKRPTNTRFIPPTLAECKTHAAEIEMSESEAEMFHCYYDARGWRSGRTPLEKWKPLMRKWMIQANHYQPGGVKRQSRDYHI